MNSELQQISNSSLAVADPWGNGAALGPAGPAAHGGGGLKKVHRLLRGRYVWAIVLGLLGGLAGGAAGYFTQKPMYRSDGVIQIQPNLPRPGDLDRLRQDYNAFMQTQSQLMEDQRVIIEAMSSEEWKGTGRGMTPQEISDFAQNLQVAYMNNSFLIRVSFTDEVASVAPRAVKSVIRAYRRLYGDFNQADTAKTVSTLESLRDTYQRNIAAKKDQMMAVGEPYSTTDLERLHVDKLDEMSRLESQLTQAKLTLEMVRSALGKRDTNTQELKLTVEEIAERDRVMADLLDQRQKALMSMRRNEAMYGANHRSVQNAKLELELIDQQVKEEAERFHKQPKAMTISPDGQNNVVVTAGTVEQMTTRVKYLTQAYEAARDQASEIGKARTKIQALTNEIDIFKVKLDQTLATLEQVNFQNLLSPELKVLSDGNLPSNPTTDKRRQMGVLGFAGGAAIPIGLVMLIGLLDPRFRYSDDAGSDMSGITLLGILPNLPDRLSDPEQAAIAAHCVHQIRTMLQINGSDQRRVFAVTSASPGDGKTSLCLALGLSFAASGSRTLLIDCDLVGGGLSSRLNIDSPEGVLEAITSRSLLEYVRTTEISDLAILPSGNARTQHASALSPGSLRRLVDLAREHFDTVLIDTGPVLGSIEASLVASVADGVVLTVARGQQRPLVERSLAHLNSIGARLSGVVFNRAQAKDFDRSVSRMSMRSVSRTSGNGQGGAGEGRIGPVANAVAGSVKGNDAVGAG